MKKKLQLIPSIKVLYDKAIRYGTDPEKPYWYICPRYWSLKDNVSLN